MYKKVYYAGSEEPVEMYDLDARTAVASHPDEWSFTPWPKKEKPEPAPAKEPVAPFEAKNKGSGWWAIYDSNGDEIGAAIREPVAQSFNAMNEEDKAEYVKAEISKS